MNMGFHPLDHLIRGSARREDLQDSRALESGDVLLWNDPSAEYDDVASAFLSEQLNHPRQKIIMRTGEDRKGYGVHIFLDGGAHDHLWRLVESRVDHLESGIPEGPSDDLRSSIVSIEPDLPH